MNEYGELFGRIILFNNKPTGKHNDPVFKGKIEGLDGKEYNITLWAKQSDRVEKGEYYTGQVKLSKQT